MVMWVWLHGCDLLELYEYVCEVPRDPCGLKDSHTEIELLTVSQVFGRRRDVGYILGERRRRGGGEEGGGG